tara:strand:- start:7691 stop:9451 length:1761 start_codon:yes stop_codon:yes gene_type:complete
MDVFKYLKAIIDDEVKALSDLGVLRENLNLSKFTVEPPRDSKHGDIASNVALVLSKQSEIPPKDLCELLLPRFKVHSDISECNIAGPGFLNFRMQDSFWHSQLKTIILEGENYGKSSVGLGVKANVEYVSANPTGPLHVGHSRGAVFGDVLANILNHVGFSVTREFYINDAGQQVDILARSVHLRYREALGENIPSEYYQDAYPGDYLIPVARELIEIYGNRFQKDSKEDWLPVFKEFTVKKLMEKIKEDLFLLGVKHDTFTSEKELVKGGYVELVYNKLDDMQLLYEGILETPKGADNLDDWEPRKQVLFKSTHFEDDTDRPLKKADGSWTYFATDIAYHSKKIDRNFDQIINVWGADHGGYIKRLNAAVSAISNGKIKIDVKLCQLVKLLENGQQLKMSKRAGQYVTLRDLVDSVGKDVVRFIMLTRKNDAPLDFDLKKVLEQSHDNPIFYVQYAHARIYSVIKNFKQTFPIEVTSEEALNSAPLNMLDNPSEIRLIRFLANWPRVLEGAAINHEPHRLAFYLQELASEFHSLWNNGKEDLSLKFLRDDNFKITQARIILIAGTASIIASGLTLLGIKPAEELR